jgi:hypothetical protein
VAVLEAADSMRASKSRTKSHSRRNHRVSSAPCQRTRPAVDTPSASGKDLGERLTLQVEIGTSIAHSGSYARMAE